MHESLVMAEENRNRVERIISKADEQFAEEKENRQRLFNLMVPVLFYFMEAKLGVLVLLLLFKSKPAPVGSNLPQPEHAAMFIIFLMGAFYLLYRIAWKKRKLKKEEKVTDDQ